MAEEGGTARSQAPAYYRVDDLSGLTGVLEKIGHREAVSCRFDLDDIPPDPGLVNVYLDGQVVPYDPKDGWAWVDQDTIELHGQACTRLKEGAAEQVQVVAGCPTEKPK
jgi:hypothetical protein